MGEKVKSSPPLDECVKKQFKLIFSTILHIQWLSILRIMYCVAWCVWEGSMPVLEAVRILGGGRVRAKSTFSFVMQLNTTAAYNWGQCSLISSFFHMTIPRSSHIGGQTTTMNTPSICIRFHNVFHIFDKLSSLWILWFDICRHMGQFLQDGENGHLCHFLNKIEHLGDQTR